jgi:hypothetical protein
MIRRSSFLFSVILIPLLFLSSFRDLERNKPLATLPDDQPVPWIEVPPAKLAGNEPIPLVDMKPGDEYKGFSGGLYPGSSNEMPEAHSLAGLQFAAKIQPLSPNTGEPSMKGKYALLSIGMSNTSMEFCHADIGKGDCDSFSFMAKAAADSSVNHEHLFIINGAKGGQVAYNWTDPDDEFGNYERINDLLHESALSNLNIQVAWIKLANPMPDPSLPDENADAYKLLEYLGDVVRTLKHHYPNLQQVFLSSRIYAGYATEVGELRNPEPYAYESGFAVKWLIEAQIHQMATEEIHPIAGDLNYETGVVPWLAWGPYLWADGPNPRQLDGLVWLQQDFAQDGVHPSAPYGREKVANLLMAFFKTSQHTRCWFLTSVECSVDGGDDPFSYTIHIPLVVLNFGNGEGPVPPPRTK